VSNTILVQLPDRDDALNGGFRHSRKPANCCLEHARSRPSAFVLLRAAKFAAIFDLR
jgi:hypothetical protein